MAESSINLTLRFLLELAALGAFAYWGWTSHDGLMRVIWAIGLPIVTAALWATFRVPGDGVDETEVVVGVAHQDGFSLCLEVGGGVDPKNPAALADRLEEGEGSAEVAPAEDEHVGLGDDEVGRDERYSFTMGPRECL